ncbi:hypothetical protein Cgig2_032657 [Carnegiea gigantea]|uniref:SWEET sugar transporter n=1 Tax=Carnegiea gigantea TaxID=171969 RepID=A0A9Q1K0F5_9CARY|nr:hypothetical protein Cgig2_032657 [Carnegiea gigantea]
MQLGLLVIPLLLFLANFSVNSANRPTFRRIIRSGSIEEFSELPYVYTLLNCLICAWYGTPFVSHDNILVTTVNSVGAIFQLGYMSLFIAYAEQLKKIGWLLRLPSMLITLLPGFISDEDARSPVCSTCAIRCTCCHELKLRRLCFKADFCWVSELCFAHLDVCLPTVYHCMSVFFL